MDECAQEVIEQLHRVVRIMCCRDMLAYAGEITYRVFLNENEARFSIPLQLTGDTTRPFDRTLDKFEQAVADLDMRFPVHEWALELAAGATDDIWFDASEYGEDAKMESIEAVQKAMQDSAKFLSGLTVLGLGFGALTQGNENYFGGAHQTAFVSGVCLVLAELLPIEGQTTKQRALNIASQLNPYIDELLESRLAEEPAH